MDPSDEMCRSLIKWLQKIVPNRTRSVVELCDGVGMLDALLQIEPAHFAKLEPKIKRDAGTHRLLKVSNLKKIVEAVLEYYQDILNLQIMEIGRPDVNKIAESSDLVQLGKLMRLILGCAINCDKKQQYITMIMEMEESVQQNIMQAIQQLEEIFGGTGRSALSLLIFDSDARVMKLVADLEAANKAEDALTQQVQALEHQVQQLIEEKQSVLQQNQILLEREGKNADARKQIELLKEDLFRAEVMRDDFKAKLFEQEKQLLTYQEKIAELQIAANDSSRLKDEIDALSESAGKVADLEMTIASYKKRLENYQDIKKNFQKLEEKNMEYLQKNMELEEELTKHSSWKTQCEAFKKQVVDLQQKLDEETQKADKAQFNLEKLESKYTALQGEKDRLLLERDSLREENEELKLGHVKSESGAAVSQELTPTDLKERLRFLEKENKTLRSSTQEIEAKQAQLDSSINRIEKLQQQNRTLNQTVLKLEAQIEELKTTQGDSQSSSNTTVIKDYKLRIQQLQEALSTKDLELQQAQAKYSRNIERAREVAQQLDSKSNGGIDSSLRHSQMKELEERLLTTAFYKLGLNCQREPMDERLAALSAGQGQSFLARQRQPTPRKQIQRFKSK